MCVLAQDNMVIWQEGYLGEKSLTGSYRLKEQNKMTANIRYKNHDISKQILQSGDDEKMNFIITRAKRRMYTSHSQVSPSL